MTTNQPNRISAATGMMLNNHKIGTRSKPHNLAARSDAIHDTLETTDSDSGQQLSFSQNDRGSDSVDSSDSVVPGDMLDISG